jgi:hypothetical protein
VDRATEKGKKVKKYNNKCHIENCCLGGKVPEENQMQTYCPCERKEKYFTKPLTERNLFLLQDSIVATIVEINDEPEELDDSHPLEVKLRKLTDDFLGLAIPYSDSLIKKSLHRAPHLASAESTYDLACKFAWELATPWWEKKPIFQVRGSFGGTLRWRTKEMEKDVKKGVEIVSKDESENRQSRRGDAFYRGATDRLSLDETSNTNESQETFYNKHSSNVDTWKDFSLKYAKENILKEIDYLFEEYFINRAYVKKGTDKYNLKLYKYYEEDLIDYATSLYRCHCFTLALINRDEFSSAVSSFGRKDKSEMLGFMAEFRDHIAGYLKD